MKEIPEDYMVADMSCSYDCMVMNKCEGHEVCRECGEVYCGCELDEDGLCESCADYIFAEEEKEERE